MNLSSVDPKSIRQQFISGGNLVTIFSRSVFQDGSEMHPAGLITNEAVTDSRGMDSENVYSVSCTRRVGDDKIVVWDSGVFVPDEYVDRSA